MMKKMASSFGNIISVACLIIYLIHVPFVISNSNTGQQIVSIPKDLYDALVASLRTNASERNHCNRDTDIVDRLASLEAKVVLYEEDRIQLFHYFSTMSTALNRLMALEKECLNCKDMSKLLSDVETLQNEMSNIVGLNLSNVQGQKGDKGDAGMDGYGVMGPRGYPGLSGFKGEKGRVGLKGDKGEIGDVGDIGSPGIPGKNGYGNLIGPKGDRGSRGFDGLPGRRGDSGLPGLPGLKGDKGEKGSRGSPGLVGPVREKGEKRVPGDTGKNESRGEPSHSVRLVGGSNERSGRVEILHDGEWGTICDHGFANNDARVICRMLGYSGNTYQNRAYYGEGTGMIWLSWVACTGSENDITECSHNGWGAHLCDHGDDAGVSC